MLKKNEVNSPQNLESNTKDEIKEPHKLKADTIKQFQSIILGGFFLIFGVAKIIDNWVAITNTLQQDVTHGILMVLLLLINMLWIFYWFYFGHNEVKLLGVNLGVNEKELGLNEFKVFVAPILIAIVFGFLLSNIFYLRYYIPIIIILYIFAAISDNGFTILVSHEVTHHLKGEKQFSIEKMKFFIAIKDYYLGTYYFSRVILALLFFGVGYFVITTDISWGIFRPIHLGYLFTIAGILISEIPLLYWRIKRNRALDGKPEAKPKRRKSNKVTRKTK